MKNTITKTRYTMIEMTHTIVEMKYTKFRCLNFCVNRTQGASVRIRILGMPRSCESRLGSLDFCTNQNIGLPRFLYNQDLGFT